MINAADQMYFWLWPLYIMYFLPQLHMFFLSQSWNLLILQNYLISELYLWYCRKSNLKSDDYLSLMQFSGYNCKVISYKKYEKLADTNRSDYKPNELDSANSAGLFLTDFFYHINLLHISNQKWM